MDVCLYTCMDEWMDGIWKDGSIYGWINGLIIDGCCNWMNEHS